MIDIGSSTCKFGYAGADLPTGVFSGRTGVLRSEGAQGPARSSTLVEPEASYVVGPSATTFRPGMELRPPTDFGLYEDWDAVREWTEFLEAIPHGSRYDENGFLKT